MASSVYEPSPRFYHSSVQVEDNAHLWGGFTQDSSGSEFINIFDCHSESWKERSTTGIPPPGLQKGCFTLLCDDLYYFGGYDGKRYHNTLHRLQTRTLEWQDIKQANPAGGPSPKCGCGMVACQQQLAVIGGVSITPTGPLQLGAEFIKTPTSLDVAGQASSTYSVSKKVCEFPFCLFPSVGVVVPLPVLI